MRKLFIGVLVVLVLSPLSAWAQSSAPKGISPCFPATLAVSGASSNVQLSTCGSSLIIMNLTSQEAFFNIGSASTVTATTSSYSLPGGAYMLLVVPGLAGTGTGWYFAAITATATTTIRLIQGSAQ